MSRHDFGLPVLTLNSKKSVVFSTKANSTTRENIASVFSAKTLSSLLPLDLSLSLEPSPDYAATRKRDATSREVHIVGFISRPVVGEGRQTADRQLFYVNSRPCSLPQVAKAINEVYKSYNITQSPFIFADLKMDTNSYDVNVSPDKRSIFLHDQTALLDALKTGLLELFERHEQTVPHTPFLNRKPYKSTSANQEDGSVKDLLMSAARAGSEPRPPWTPINKDATDRMAYEAQNDRVRQKDVEAAKPSEMETEDSPLSSGTSSLSPGIRNLDRVGQFNRTLGADIRPIPTEHEGNENTPEPAVDELPDSAHVGQSMERNMTTGGADGAPCDDVEVEEPISSQVPVSSVRSSGEFPNAFDRMRRPRMSEDIATVRIGNTVTTTQLGGPRPKRQKLIISPKAPSTAPARQENSILLKSLRSFVAGAPSGDGSMDELLKAHGEPKAAEDSAPDDSEGESTGSPDESDAEQGNNVEEVADGGSDGEFVDEAEKKKRDEEKIAKMIAAAERLASRPTEDNLRRAISVLKARSRKGATLRLLKKIDAPVSEIHRLIQNLAMRLQEHNDSDDASRKTRESDEDGQAEERLALAVSKSDFARMKVVGQFNLGFILAMRPGRRITRDGAYDCDELFIIDQHASDEKYNFERLQAETVVQNQRLVHPQRLSLTAVEEELILHHPEALAKNGFGVDVDESGARPVGRRCALASLPMSREVVFDATDLEELLALLADHQGAGEVPRPSKVRRMFAMRACRSSIMVGRTLTPHIMQTVVGHMGEIDKPWNCPHGRPTMRHLFGMGRWRGWREGEGLVGLGEERRRVDWKGFLKGAEDAAESDQNDDY